MFYSVNSITAGTGVPASDTHFLESRIYLIALYPFVSLKHKFFHTIKARLEDKTQTIEDQTVDMFGVERSVLSSASESVCRSYFLRDG